MNQRSRFKGHLHSKPCAQGKCGSLSSQLGEIWLHVYTLHQHSFKCINAQSDVFESIQLSGVCQCSEEVKTRCTNNARPCLSSTGSAQRSCRHGRTTCFRQIRCVEPSSTYLTYSTWSQSLPRTLQSPCFILLQMKAVAPVPYLPVLSR